MISRQRRWQLRQEAAGRCTICGRPGSPEFKRLCAEHALRSRQRGREGLAGVVQGFSDVPVNLKPRRVAPEHCVAILMRAGYGSEEQWRGALAQARAAFANGREYPGEPGYVRFYESP